MLKDKIVVFNLIFYVYEFSFYTFNTHFDTSEFIIYVITESNIMAQDSFWRPIQWWPESIFREKEKEKKKRSF